MKANLLVAIICLLTNRTCLANELLLQCMDAKGTEKKFTIDKVTKMVRFSPVKDGPTGTYRETPSNYFLSFPATDTRLSAVFKINRNTGMLEFESGKPPYLLILWTANCSESPVPK